MKRAAPQRQRQLTRCMRRYSKNRNHTLDVNLYPEYLHKMCKCGLNNNIYHVV